MDSVAFKLQAANTLRTAKSKLFVTKDEEGHLCVGNIVRLYLYVACAILAFLSFIAMFSDSFIKGLVCMLIAFTIAFVELTWLLPPVEKLMIFFLENYIWRACAYSLLAIPTFFSWTTFVGGILILAGAAGYGYCFFKKEKPQLASANHSSERVDLSQEIESSAFDKSDLLSDYQQV